MEKRKNWQFFVILAVIAFTLYSIFPTIFYYSKPLNEEVNAPRAHEVALEITNRVNQLEKQTIDWVSSYTDHLHLKTSSIQLDPKNPSLVHITFENERAAQIFKSYIPTAGSLINFPPAQLSLVTAESDGKTVTLERKMGYVIAPDEIDTLFQFSKKINSDGKIAPLYKNIIVDRASHLMHAIGGESFPSKQIQFITQNSSNEEFDPMTIALAEEILDYVDSFGLNHPLTKRYFASFSQTGSQDKGNQIHQLIARFETTKTRLNQQLEQAKKNNEGQKERSLLSVHIDALTKASDVVKKNIEAFKAGRQALTQKEIMAIIQTGADQINANEYIQRIDLTGLDPFLSALVINWAEGTIDLEMIPELSAINEKKSFTEIESRQKEKLEHHLYNTIARLSRESGEKINPHFSTFRIALDRLSGSSSLLAIDLGSLASKESDHLFQDLSNSWTPTTRDLNREHYPIRSWETFSKETPEARGLGLVVYAPAAHADTVEDGFNSRSVYLIARGLQDILEQYRDIPGSAEALAFQKEIGALQTFMRERGYVAYPGSYLGKNSPYAKDYIFELRDFFNDFIAATREDFSVQGSGKYAVLEFTNVEQRILTHNRIEDAIQDDLVRSIDDFNAAQASLQNERKYSVAPPTTNPYFHNLGISFSKYFDGDERKILKWGLDLSGGKSVRIGLKNQNHETVKNPEELKQAANELYNRVNKMGVAERAIRIEGETILLDFPGSQGFSATELVKASSMTFHIVNEKFRTDRGELSSVVNQFLQDVWNEALVTNKKDAASINEIAWKKLGGNTSSADIFQPTTEAARILFENGLRIASPESSKISSALDDSSSSIALLRGDEPSEWYGNTHPLVIIFHNYALEGSSLSDVQVGYDPSEGNTLSFSVSSSYSDGRKGSPREDFYAWTSQFAKEKIEGTSRAAYSPQGYRMAVILNGRLINMPYLKGALSNQGRISGAFTHREINQLAADLKAGSLSFTPQILSEQNVSPELGKEDRMRGIIASIIAVILVAATMIGYYRFAGFVATCAVLFNVLIIWAVLESLGAALTLPGIAGIVLTIGMAVDANVLVFERIREEFSHSGRIASAIQAGYKKAFSAIIDSNITTLIAALILIQFDSGPIKGFAIVIMIGIISSMFSALFMTRYYFTGWAQNAKHTTLKMANWIGKTSIPFLKYAKTAMMISGIIILFGSFLVVSQHRSLLGMDFTGGYSLTLDMKEGQDIDYRRSVYEALVSAGAYIKDVEVRQLSRPTQLRIQIGMSMEEEGHPYFGLPEEITGEEFTYNYQSNPRINWIVGALEAKGLKVQSDQLARLDKQWSAMSGQLSDAMRNNALIALGLAFLGILIYITFRFEFKYAIGAVVALAHDVAITVGILALFHKLGFPAEINLQVIGAIMTIIGYSLNDTIIIFDRIREEAHLQPKKPFNVLVNEALNVTLSRTVMTSLTTLLVLLALDIFGGASIFAFSIVMTIGVVVGTLSSLFIAAPVMLFFHHKEKSKENAIIKI